MERERSVYWVGAHRLEVVYGDVVSVPADVLVSSDDNYLSMGGGVSASIAEAGGSAIEQHARALVPPGVPSPFRRGDVAVTTAGQLEAQYIFHAITIDLDRSHGGPTTESLESATRRCMELAAALRIRSIAFPALGTGVGGFAFAAAADTMLRTITRSLGDGPCPADVTIALFARPGIRETDLTTFYESAVGLIALWGQGKQLTAALAEVASQAEPNGRSAQTDHLASLSDRLSVVVGDLDETPTDVDTVDEERVRTVTQLATEVVTASRATFVDDNSDSDASAASRDAAVQACNLKRNALVHLIVGLERRQLAGGGDGSMASRLATAVASLTDLDRQIESLKADIWPQTAVAT